MQQHGAHDLEAALARGQGLVIDAANPPCITNSGSSDGALKRGPGSEVVEGARGRIGKLGSSPLRSIPDSRWPAGAE